MKRIFVSGTGTGIGKTLVSAVLAEALEADYWKPVQAGYDNGTDSEWVAGVITNGHKRIQPETYKLKLPASPHIAAREEGIRIDLEKIAAQVPDNNRNLIIEGAGGLLVPLNEDQFMPDLAKRLEASLVLVSLNTLGSINHSLLTARVCRQENIPVLGWIFNGSYLHYEEEIVRWSGYSRIASIPYAANPDSVFIQQQAEKIRRLALFG
ncbi:MAG: dethiobiotin synthase [Chitinophagaceae bacterium]|nr:dethiobiotin synthase [Chitinophagaceae bacterium]